MGGTSEALALQLARLVAASRPDDVPAEVRHEAVRSYVNWLGCALGGAESPAVNAADAALAPFSGAGEVVVPGRAARRDALLAALLGGLASSAWAFDDTHAQMLVHPASPVAAAVQALAGRMPISGAKLLHALILGIEVKCRFARAIALPPARTGIHWYLSGLTGGIGAAAACGWLLGLDAERLAWAMSIAASQGAGYRATHVAMTVGLVPGHAGQMGLRAALLAQAGFTGAADFFEHPRGFATAFAAEAAPAALLAGWGGGFEIMHNTYKPFPCGIVIHPLIDASLRLRAAHAPDPAAIARVEARLHPSALTLADRRHPLSDMQALVSLHHWAACALLRGRAGLDELAQASIDDAAVRALRDLVHPVADPAIPPEGAAIVLHLRDGTRHALEVRECIGSAGRPMNDAELSAKFMGQAETVLGPARAATVLAASWKVADLAEMSAFSASLLPGVG